MEKTYVKDIYECGSLTIDLENRTISKGGRRSLTSMESGLLQCFRSHRNQVLTKGILLENTWNSFRPYELTLHDRLKENADP